MAMMSCAGTGHACMSYQCVGAQPPHRVVHCTLLGLPVAQQVYLAHLGMSGSKCMQLMFMQVADRWSVALDLFTDFFGDVQTEGTERPHQATSSQQPLGLSQAPSASCSASMAGATLGAAPHVPGAAPALMRHASWMIWWMAWLTSGLSERTTSFMATLRAASIPKDSRTSACKGACMSVVALKTACFLCY